MANRTPLERANMAVYAAEEKARRLRGVKEQAVMTIYLQDQHFHDAIRAEADILGMSVSSFMR
jgi:hypothetical protein